MNWVKIGHEKDCDGLSSDIFFGRQFHSHDETEEENSRLLDEFFKHEQLEEAVKSSASVPALLSNRALQVVVLLLAISIVQTTFIPISGSCFRSVPIKFAERAIHITNPNINLIIFYENGCKVPYISTSSVQSGTFIVSFRKTINLNSFTIV